LTRSTTGQNWLFLLTRLRYVITKGGVLPPQSARAGFRHQWLGNVQYRPFTADGPVHEAPGELRAVTLEDLIERAKRRPREVIPMARQCGLCGRPRARALRALLDNPSLRVFSRLVLDRATAEELLK
jgi:hypothetical protein